MTNRFDAPSGRDLPLLPAREDVQFALKKGTQYVPLKHSQWSYRRIVISQEAARLVKGELHFSVSLGDFHRPWEPLKGEVRDGNFLIATQNSFLETLYKNQGSVSTTLNLVGGPLTTYPRYVSGGLRKFVIGSLILAFLAFLVSFGIYQSQYRSLVLENKTQTTELQKNVSREQIRVAGHQKQKQALESEITLLAEQYRVALARQETLQKLSDQGLLKGDTLYLASLQSHTLSLQIAEKKRELTKLSDELVAWNQLLAEQKTLQEQSEALTQQTYWRWLQGHWQ